MNNYKIKVNNEPESKEAQKLFFQLGYEWYGCGAAYNPIDGFKFITAYADEMRLAMGWGEDADKELTLHQLRDLVAQRKNEQGLISGADALRALADGKEVEYLYGADNWLSVIEMQVMITAFTGSKFKFRLKPRTTKLSLEIPAPFEPKLGETYYFITTSNSQGFDFTEFDDSDGDKLYMQLGAYRSASDASKVFEALRGGIKG